MQVTTSNLPLAEIEADAIYLSLFEGEGLTDPMLELDKSLNGWLSDFLKLKEFKGRLYEISIIYTQGKIKTPRIILVGNGKKEDFEPERLTKNVAGVVARRVGKAGAKRLVALINQPDFTDEVVKGVILGDFDSALYKSKKETTGLKELILIGADTKQIKRSASIAETTNWVRQLVDEPANVMTPRRFVEEAKKIARNYNLGIEIIDEKEAKRRKMGAFLAIASGSDEPSFVVSLRYKAPKETKTTLGVIGKGITFDSGGISIKPSDKMHEMKIDMAGAAAMLGIMKLVGEFKPKVNVVGVAPVTENLPSGKAAKPADVVKSLSGKTIEILNTDAEGRVVLSDAITYAQKLGANKIYEMSTLTGAVSIILGSEAAAIMGKSQEWLEKVINAGRQAGERLWSLPLYKEYKELLRSDIADMANIPPSRGAGTIAGAVFLEEFVENSNDWVHLDIADVAWLSNEKPYLAKGATGAGIGTALKLIEDLDA